MKTQVWYWPNTNEIILVNSTDEVGVVMVDWGDELDLYQFTWLTFLGFIFIGEL